MSQYCLDIVFVLIVAATAIMAAVVPFVRATVFFIASLAASLLAMAGYEHLAHSIGRAYLLNSFASLSFYLEFLVIGGLFLGCLFPLLWLARVILPEPPVLSRRTESFGSWTVGVLNGCCLASFAVTALQTYPAPVDFWGALPARVEQRPGPIMCAGPDMRFLTLAEYTCGDVFVFRGDWTVEPQLTADTLGGSHWYFFDQRCRFLRLQAQDYFESLDEEWFEPEEEYFEE